MNQSKPAFSSDVSATAVERMLFARSIEKGLIDQIP